MTARAPHRVIIADDEALARERLRQLISPDEQWSIVAECRNGAEAVDAILEHRPDVVFLDIRMPGLDGLEVAEAIADDDASTRAPIIVFVSAYDEFALRAFDVSAADYVLKPVDRERFAKTLARLAERLTSATSNARVADVGEVIASTHTEPRYSQRFLVRSPRGYYFVQANDVEWVEAEGNYAALHAGGRVHLVRQTMKTMEQRLDPALFARIHRSAIVNTTAVEAAEPLGHGEYRIRLRGGAHVDTSRAYSARVQAMLKE